MTINLDPQQRAAVETDSHKVLCLSSAGSGKTRVIVERVAHLIEEHHISPYEVVSVSFTRKASNELRERIIERVGPGSQKVVMGTIHSLALRYLRQFGDLIGWKPKHLTVYSEFEESFLLKECATDLGIYNGKSWKIPRREIQEVFDEYYQQGITPEEDHPCRAIFDEVRMRCMEYNALTYGGLLIEFLNLLPGIYQHLPFKHLFVDECQDLAPLQWKIFNCLKELCGADLFVVGDISQCQPTGTKVLLADNSEVPIETLDPKKHELRSYDKHDCLIYGGGNKGYTFSISKRLYSGPMLKIQAGKFKTKCTLNHKWWVKWADKSRNLNVVYLMQKEARFRVGWCQLFGSCGFHLGQRTRLEEADSVWILKVFDNKRDASLYEQIISVKYGIPTIMFNPNGIQYYDKAGIDYVYRELGKYFVMSNGYRCLHNHGLSALFPIWSKENKNEKRGSQQIFGISSYNLVDGLFKFPVVRNGGRLIDWEVGKITRYEEEDVFVYSLDVGKNHTYIADGLCTRNSIYSWRGAVPEYLIEHASEFDIYPIGTNYRSVPEIVSAANNLIKNNSTVRLPLDMVPNRTDHGEITIEGNADSEKVARMILSYHDIYHPNFGETTAVLGRNHFLLKKLATILESVRYPFTYIGRTNELIQSETFRKFHAFLKLTVNPFDSFSFLLIRDLLGISRKEYGEIRLKAIRESKSHFQVWRETPSEKSQWWDMWETEPFEIQVSELENFPWIEDAAPILSFIRVWKQDNPMGTIQDYLDWLAVFDLQDEVKDDDTRLKLISCHGAKGLQWKTVILIGCNEGIIPSKQSIESGEDIQICNERNLMYVACTRAEDHLILAVRPEEKTDDKGKVYKNPVSRFIGEMK